MPLCKNKKNANKTQTIIGKTQIKSGILSNKQEKQRKSRKLLFSLLFYAKYSLARSISFWICSANASFEGNARSSRKKRRKETVISLP